MGHYKVLTTIIEASKISTVSPEKKRNLFIQQMHPLRNHLRAHGLPDIILSPGDIYPFKICGLRLQETQWKKRDNNKRL